MDEIARYLTSIFKVLYQIQPQMRSQTGVSAEELGAITAEQAFAAADSNGDGKLSYKEFLNWYSSPDIISENEAQPGQLASHTTKLAVIDSPLRWIPLNEIKHITNLHAFEPDSIFEIFATHADGKGLLSRTAFNVSFNEIFARDSTIHKRTPEQKQFIKDVVNGLFDLFDADGSGYVDFGELASGLSVLCGMEYVFLC
jgi:Ca2+-binding EF-hand superfamily protein